MAPSRERADWADIAKGASILGVVLLHVSGSFAREICGERNASLCTPWGEFNAVITPLRLPLFFAISGFFAQSALTRPWREVARPRVLSLLYVYVLWTVLFLALQLSLELKNETQFVRSLSRMWLGSGYWFIYALPLFFVVAKVTRRLHATVVLALGTGIALGAPVIWQHVTGSREIEDVRVFRVTFYFVYFALGARCGPLIAWAAERGRSLLGTLVAAALLVAMERVYVVTDYDDVARFAVSITAILTGAALAMALSRFAAARWFGRVVGRRTLGLYLLHVLLARAGLGVLLREHPELVDFPAAEWIVPPTAAALITVVALLTYAAMRRFGLRWMFELPSLRRRRPVEVLGGR